MIYSFNKKEESKMRKWSKLKKFLVGLAISRNGLDTGK